MKKYNVILKKNNQLVLSFITYDRRIERKLLRKLEKLKRVCNVVEAIK